MIYRNEFNRETQVETGEQQTGFAVFNCRAANDFDILLLQFDLTSTRANRNEFPRETGYVVAVCFPFRQYRGGSVTVAK